MKDLLLGWLTKPMIEYTLIDNFIVLVEILIGVAIVFFIISGIVILKDKIKEWRKEKKENEKSN